MPSEHNDVHRPDKGKENETDDHGKSGHEPGNIRSDTLARIIKRLRDGLEEGGPEVSHPLIAAYIDGELDANERETVRQLIDQYRNWNDAYWDVWCAIKDADDKTSDT